MTSPIPPTSALPPISPSAGDGGSHGGTSATLRPGAASSSAATPVAAPASSAAITPIVQAMHSALAHTVELSPQALQAIKLEAFARLLHQLIGQIQPAKVELPASWPAGGVTPTMQQMLAGLLQQLTAGQPLPQQLVSLQSWPAQLTQAVLQHAGAAAAPSPTAASPGTQQAAAAPLPALQQWLVQQGSIQASDGARAFTLSLHVPTSWAQAHATLAAALPGMATAAAPAVPGTVLPPLAFAGSVQQLASGSFGIVMQPQAVPGSAAAATAQAMRTSAILQLEFQPLAQAAAQAPAAAIYLPAHLSQQEVQAMLQGRGTDPWLLMAQAQADGSNRPQRQSQDQPGLCNRAGCQYQGRASCAQPFCAEMNYLWSIDRAQRR